MLLLSSLSNITLDYVLKIYIYWVLLYPSGKVCAISP